MNSKKERCQLQWEIKEVGYNKDQIVHFGNKFLIGILKLGVRGTLDEYQKNIWLVSTFL